MAFVRAALFCAHPHTFPHISARCSSSPSPASFRTCRVCKKAYQSKENGPAACRFHPATWTGAERSKFYGRIPESPSPSVAPSQIRGTEYYYDCCDARAPGDPGCTFSFHRGYDE